MFFPLHTLPRRRHPKPKADMTPERLERLKALSSLERNQYEIAFELGVSPSTVGRYQRDLGLPRPPRGVRCGA